MASKKEGSNSGIVCRLGGSDVLRRELPPRRRGGGNHQSTVANLLRATRSEDGVAVI